MTVNVVPLAGDGHHSVQALLPWFVRGQLAADEAATVEAHLANCAACRAELALERRMAEVLADADADDAADPVAVEHGLARLHARIARDGPAPAAAATAAPARPRAGPRPSRLRRWTWRWPAAWTPWLLGAQFAAIGGLVALLVLPPQPTAADRGYRTLAAPGHAAAGNAVVRFRPQATERDIRLALQAAGARLVDGPTSTDAYLLSVPGDRPQQALATLRAQPAVLLAESLDAGPRP